MGVFDSISRWPVLQQLRRGDWTALGETAKSPHSEEPPAPHRDRRQRRPLGLPLLRGRLRPARLRPGRPHHRHRRGPRLPHLPGLPLPQGRGHLPARHRLAPPARGPVSPAPSAPAGRSFRSRGRWTWSRDRVKEARDDTWQEDGRGGQPGPPHARHRQPRRRHPGQRGELPHQEAVLRAGHRPDREPGPNMTLLHGPRSGDLLRSRWGDDVPAGPPERGLHRDPGVQHGRVPPGRLPLGDGGQGARRDDHPRRSALHPHQRRGRPPRADPRRQRHRVPRRAGPPRPGERTLLPGVRRRLHQRPRHRRRGLPRHRGPRRPVQRLGPGDAAVRPRLLAVRGRHAAADRPGG